MKVLERGMLIENMKSEMYLGNKIIAWQLSWEQFNENKNKWENKKEIACNLYRLKSKRKVINLGECNNGDKFVAVNQAINQAKDYVNCCDKYNW